MTTEKQQPWEMTLEEWLSAPRTWEGGKRLLTLNEWRSMHGYSNPLEDHGDFRHPHGISKITAKRIKERFHERLNSAIEGSIAYHRALENGSVPEVIDVHEIRSDGLDTEQQLARARIYHKRQVRAKLSQTQQEHLSDLTSEPF